MLFRQKTFNIIIFLLPFIAEAQWTVLPFNTGYQNHAISFISKDTGYVSNGIWQGPPPGTNHTKLYKTTNGGNNWIAVVDDYINTPICQMHFVNENFSIYRRWQDNVLKTRNACTTYTTILNTGGSSSGDSFQVLDSLKYLYSRNDNVYYTLNGGTSWTTKNTIAYQSFFGGNVRIQFENLKNGFVYGQIYFGAPTFHTEFKVFSTTDSSNTLQLSYHSGKPNATGGIIKFINPTTALMTLDDVVLRTTNFGSTWDTIYTFTSPEKTMAIDVKNNYVIISGNYGTILTSTNAGLTFQNNGTAPGVPISLCITSINPVIVYGMCSNNIIKLNLLTTNLDEKNNSPFVVYPNPTSDYLHLELPYKVDETINIEITTISGQIVKSMKSQSNSLIEINVSELKSGTYIIKIKSSSFVKVQKFIKE